MKSPENNHHVGYRHQKVFLEDYEAELSQNVRVSHKELKATIHKIDDFLSSYDKHRQSKIEEFFNSMHSQLEQLKKDLLSSLEEVQLRQLKDQLFKQERELINYEEFIEEKRMVQLIKLNDDIFEASENIKESDILSSKLIRQLRNLNLTYTFNEETLYERLSRVVQDQLVYISIEDSKKKKFFEKYSTRSPESIQIDKGIQSEEEYEY